MTRTDRRRWHLVLGPALVTALALGPVRPLGAQAQNPFLGSVPAGPPSATPLDLSLPEAIDRALKANLGAIEGHEGMRAAEAARLRSLNALVTNVSARVSASENQVNPAAQGLNIKIPGVTLPAVFGPFGVNDARVAATQEIFNLSDRRSLKASTELAKAAESAYANDRELVVLTAGSAYLVVIADAAAVDSIQAQVTTADALYRQDQDKNAQGVIAKIDVLRAQVELQTEKQRLIAAQNQLSIDKLTLARVIGLPNAQEFRLTDTVPFSPLGELTLEEAVARAVATRPDYLGAQRQVTAAELTVRASAAEAYPSASAEADYGQIGSPNFGAAHGTFSAGVALAIPIFQGTKVRADTLQASAALAERQAELADLGARIDDEVRTAFYNLKSSSELVSVAQSNVQLAGETLSQARDRNTAGVADNLEIVQAQESVASANQSYIASLYAFNVAKLSLAQALGVAEQQAVVYLLGRK